MLTLTRGPYSGLLKQPEALIYVPHQTLPPLVVEAGFSESYDDSTLPAKII
jgi:hypothetical protein